MAWSQILDLLKNGILRGKEVGSLLMHAVTPITHTFLHYSWFFVFLSFFYSFFFVFFLFSSPLFPLFTVHVYGLLYYLLWQVLPFLPLHCFWPIVGVFLGLPTSLPVAQLPPLHYVGHAMPHSQTKVVLFYFLLPLTLTSG